MEALVHILGSSWLHNSCYTPRHYIHVPGGKKREKQKALGEIFIQERTPFIWIKDTFHLDLIGQNCVYPISYILYS